MARKTFSANQRSDNLNFNLPTTLLNAGYRLVRVMNVFWLLDRKGNTIKEWYFMPSLAEMFELEDVLL